MSILKDFQQGANEPKAPGIILALDHLPVFHEGVIPLIQNRIQAIEPLKQPVKIEIEPAGSALNDGSKMLGVITFDDHRIRLVGFNLPVPLAVQEKTIQPSFWQPEQKQAIQNHQAHILLIYAGNATDRREQYIALYKVAFSFLEEGLRGILNETAWTAQPASFVQEFGTVQSLNIFRQYLPLNIFTGLVKFVHPNGIWFTTKGQTLFDVPEFAMQGKEHSEGSVKTQIFESIFNYAYSSKVHLAVGHTLQIGDQTYLRFSQVTEYQEYMPNTLLLEMISGSEINPH